MTTTTDEGVRVYRLYDAAGALLYVGASKNPAARLDEHRGKPWFAEVADVKVDWYATRREALRAETDLIVRESPPHNQRRSLDSDPVRTVRVSDKLWNAVQDRAWELRDRSVLADYIRLALRAFVKDAHAARAALEEIAGLANDSEE